MELKAVIVLGSSEPAQDEHWSGRLIPTLEVLGKPVVDHVIDRLQRFGVDAITVITPQELELRKRRKGISLVSAAEDQLWRSAEAVFNLYAQLGAEVVLVLRMGAYLEFDLDHILHFHHESKNRVTRVVDEQGRSLDFAVIDASRRNDAAYLFRTQLRETRVPAAEYKFSGYCNPLREIADVRRLTQDALMLDCELRPAGEQIKPGVWVGEDAKVDKSARLVAPCYVGAGCEIEAGAVVTRMSAIERESQVDLGTMVENSNILPLSYVGPGLDICHSVVGHSKVANLTRKATVAVGDPKLTAELPSSALVRSLAGYADAFTRAAAALITSFSFKRSASREDTGKVEHAPVVEKSRAAVR
jgi:NDP-sugar pyrophosphorylase family protein